ncbi:MAG TPA: hypothetical protein VMJ10_11225 [Kofleriaceae bacterium]|nr:hypothetical protein [Kofleriaceae bacterium]
MTDDERTKYPIASLPAPDANEKSTMAAEEIARIVARVHAKIAGTVASVGQEQRQREEREATERAARAALEQERRAVAMYDADARRRRGDGNISFGQSAAVVGAATALGTVIGGPRGALGGAVVGWIIDRAIQGR